MQELTAADVVRAWREVSTHQAIAVAQSLGILPGLYRQGFIDAMCLPKGAYAKGYALGAEARRMMEGK